MPERHIAVELRKGLRHLAIATGVLYAVVIGLTVLAWFDSAAKSNNLKRETQRTNQALCTFRADLEQRVRSSEKFLAEHPKGIPGIPIATIRNSLDNQRRTIDSLNSLHC